MAVAEYDAFLSYRHADHRAARALHERIESYRLPGPIARAMNRPRRLRVFLDDAELRGAQSLTKELEARLTAARNLVVVCAPRVAASKWVRWEIEAFRKHAPDRVIPVLIEGEPEDAIPRDLFDPADNHRQALFPDLRKRGTAGRREFLRLLAFLHDCEFDLLVQRDRSRRRRQFAMIATTVTLLAVAVGTYGSLASQAVAASRVEVARVVSERSKSELATVQSIADSRATMDIGGLLRLLSRQQFATDGGLGFQRKRLDGDLQDDIGQSAKALACYQESHADLTGTLASEGRTPDLLRELALAWDRIGDAQRSLGLLAAAQESYDSGVAIAQELPQQAAPNRRALAFLLVGRGDVACDQGRAPAALDDYRAAAQIREELAESGQGDDALDAAIANLKVGDALSCLGKPDALQRYAEACQRLADLSGSMAGDKRVRRGLAIARQRLGHAFLDAGHHDKALAEFMAGCEVIAESARMDPENRVLQVVAADSHRWIGDAFWSSGKVADAEREFRQAATSLIGLSRANPDHVQWRVAATRALLRTANARHARGDASGAIDELRQAVGLIGDADDLTSADQRAALQEALARALLADGNSKAALDCGREGLRLRESIAARSDALGDQVRLAWSQHGLAQMLDQSGAGREALPLQRKAVELLDQLRPADAPEAPWVTHRRIYVYRHYSLLLRRSSAKESVAWARRAVAEGETLVAISPMHPAWQRALATALEGLGLVTTANDQTTAERALSRACELARDLNARNPDDLDLVNTLAWWLMELGDVHWEDDDHRPAIARYQESLALIRELCSARPDSDRLADACARNLRWLGELYLADGRPSEAIPFFREGVAIHRRLAERQPDVPAWPLGAAITRGGEAVALFQAGALAESWPAIQEATAVLGGRVLADNEDNLACVTTLAGLAAGLEDPRAAHAAREQAIDWLGRWMKIIDERIAQMPPSAAGASRLRAMAREVRDASHLQPLRSDPRFASIFAFCDRP